MDIGLATMGVQRMMRHRAASSGVLSQTLGKNLSHHQVLPADQQPRVANAPRTDNDRAVLSSTGGNPRMVNTSKRVVNHVVGQISPFAARALHRDNISAALKFVPQSLNIKSG